GVGLARARKLAVDAGLAFLHRAAHAVVGTIARLAAVAARGRRPVLTRATLGAGPAERARRAFQVLAARARVARIVVGTLRITAAGAAALARTAGAAAGTRRVAAQVIDAAVDRARVVVRAVRVGAALLALHAAGRRAILILIRARAGRVGAEAGEALVV